MLVLALAALTLTPPVPGTVERPFEYAGDPFARGHHRGLDLAASPGAPVRAACPGRVTFAGRAGASGRAVTIRCGGWSVTHLPLRGLTVRAGEHVVAGAPIGRATTAPGHTGLHLGVRRASDRFGYVDPAPLLRAPPRPAPPAGPRAHPWRTASPPPHPAPLPSTAPAGAAPLPSTAPAGAAPLPSTGPAGAAPRPGSSPAPHAAPSAPRALAPWPAWAGLALLLAGAAGAGTARARRTRRAASARAAPAPVR